MNLTFKRATRLDVRAVPGLAGYEVDARGNVYSTHRGVERRRLRPGLASNGYLTVSLHRKSYTVHSIVRAAFLPGGDGLVINHKDGNKQNNRLENLELVTSSENNRHAFTHGLRKAHTMRGEQITTSVLTDSQVRSIRAALANGDSCASIGRAFGVSRTTISKIKNLKNWNHIN